MATDGSESAKAAEVFAAELAIAEQPSSLVVVTVVRGYPLVVSATDNPVVQEFMAIASRLGRASQAMVRRHLSITNGITGGTARQLAP